jgi:hypothetical protein
MQDEKLIVTLEQNLRETRKQQNRLKAKLNEIKLPSGESTLEEGLLKREIDALENAAKQTETAIYALLATMRKKQN